MSALVLGIDAAWTAHHPSGYCLIAGQPGQWNVDSLAPNSPAFCHALKGQEVDWKMPPSTTQTTLGLKDILEHGQHLGRWPIDVIAVDMPIGRDPVLARRPADNFMSSAFTKYGCPVHSPLPDRPGPISHQLCQDAQQAGFEILTTDSNNNHTPGIMEVYPHAALVSLLGLSYRLPYKSGRTTQYWPGLSKTKRVEKLLQTWTQIIATLSGKIAGIPAFVPDIDDAPGWTFRQLKAIEDGLDALICAWVGCEYLEGRTLPYGNADAAIWNPRVGLD